MGAIQRVAGTLPIALDSHHSPARGFLAPVWVTFGRSRVRESRTLGSVGAKAEWLSSPTATLPYRLLKSCGISWLAKRADDKLRDYANKDGHAYESLHRSSIFVSSAPQLRLRRLCWHIGPRHRRRLLQGKDFTD